MFHVLSLPLSPLVQAVVGPVSLVIKLGYLAAICGKIHEVPWNQAKMRASR
jgi:hypothetical protein